MTALSMGLFVVLLVSMPVVLYIMFEDVLDFVEQDILPLFRD